MIIALLTTLMAIGATGYMMGMHACFGVEWLEDAHSTLVSLPIIQVGLHLTGVWAPACVTMKTLWPL